MKQEEFDKYMESYKKLTLLEKQDIIVKQLKILASFTNSLCKEIGADNNIMINKELLDLKNNNYTEDDFAEAVIVLINSLQNSICDFHLKYTEILSEKMQ